jgi:molybdate transport system permease protein
MRHRPPWVLVPPAIVGFLFLLLPTLGLLIRVPWSDLVHIYSHDQSSSGVDVSAALRLSVVTSTVTAVVSLLLGVPLAWMLARVHLPGRALIRAVVLLPLVLPPVVGGLALLLTFGSKGVAGRYLDEWFGVTLSFSRTGIVIAQTFVAMPFLVITVEAAFRTANRELEDAAATDGATRNQIFRHITLPLVVPALVAGTVLCWARALGEFGATLLFAGNVVDRTQTGPTAVLTAFQTSPQEAVALALPLMLVAVVVLAALREKWLRASVAG